MYVYYIQNRQTLKLDMIFGYNLRDAFSRSKIEDPKNWVVIDQDYED